MKRYSEYKDSGVKWIGEIPGHWKVMRLSQIAYDHFISNKKIHHQNLLSLSYGQIIRKDINGTNGLLPASFDTYQVVEEGNIILRLTDLQNDHKSLRVGLVKETGIITSAYLCLAPQNMVYSKYLYFQLHACDIKKVFYSMGDGLRQSLNFDGMRKLASVIPPLSEQQAIVTYLDTKVAKIDEYISIAEKKIAALEELKQTIIAEAVTRGIHKEVPMKDSGVFWQPQIPKSWSVTLIKHILYKMKRSRPINAEILICSNKGTVFKRGESKTGLISDDESIYQGVKSGDLLIHGMDTWHGAIAISNYNGMCTPVVHVCESTQNKAYIAYYLRNMATAKVFKLISNGVRQNTSDFRSWDKMGNVPVCLPPLPEQQKIVTYLDSKITNINQLCQAERSQIEKLKEYKQRLISDVVTGKVKVTND